MHFIAWPNVTYLPQANVPAQCIRWTNAFTAARGDKTAMRPLAKLLSTLIIRPHRLHTVRKVRPIDVARSVVCVFVYWHTVSCAKSVELIEMPFAGLTHVGPRNHY